MKNKINHKIIAIVGTTASGKTKLAVSLAHKYNGEIVSADSRQVYRGMDIGTGKDLNEFKVESSKLKVGNGRPPAGGNVPRRVRCWRICFPAGQD